MMVGQQVENFQLKDQYGNVFDLYKNLDRKVLLIFYPKDSTRVCSRQLSSYQLNESLFGDKKIRLIGINIDNLESHRIFCEEINIKFPLLYDENKTVSRRFGALSLLGINKRKLILINTDKKIVLEKDSSYFSYPSAEEIIKETESVKI